MTTQKGRMKMAELEPITRKEQYLAKAAGQDVETPEPITREEMYLDAIAKGGGGGGGGSSPGMMLVTYTIDWGEDEGDVPIVTSCDKTLAQILAHLEAGGNVYATYGEDGIIMNLKQYAKSNVIFYYVGIYKSDGNLDISYEEIMHQYVGSAERMSYETAWGTVATI